MHQYVQVYYVQGWIVSGMSGDLKKRKATCRRSRMIKTDSGKGLAIMGRKKSDYCPLNIFVC